MAVAGIGQLQRRDQGLVAHHQAVPRFRIHQVARPFQRGALTVRLVPQQRLDPFPMYIRAPFRAKLCRDVVDRGRGVQVLSLHLCQLAYNNAIIVI
jgi:hypothetical protein